MSDYRPIVRESAKPAKKTTAKRPRRKAKATALAPEALPPETATTPAVPAENEESA